MIGLEASLVADSCSRNHFVHSPTTLPDEEDRDTVNESTGRAVPTVISSHTEKSKKLHLPLPLVKAALLFFFSSKVSVLLSPRTTSFILLLVCTIFITLATSAHHLLQTLHPAFVLHLPFHQHQRVYSSWFIRAALLGASCLCAPEVLLIQALPTPTMVSCSISLYLSRAFFSMTLAIGSVDGRCPAHSFPQTASCPYRCLFSMPFTAGDAY
jgi:hypothetical protein